MNSRDFSLQLFAPGGPGRACRVTGRLARGADTLAIGFVLRGGPGHLVIPAPAESPSRRHGLWKETCCELFLAVKDLEPYWEFNLSPAGHWNVYHFDGYRRGMIEETRFTSLPLRVRRELDSLLLDLELDLGSIVPAASPLEVGLAAVIKAGDGGLSYWALTHPGPQADFHRRDGFRLGL
jgi:hypothetical protein